MKAIGALLLVIALAGVVACDDRGPLDGVVVTDGAGNKYMLDGRTTVRGTYRVHKLNEGPEKQ